MRRLPDKGTTYYCSQSCLKGSYKFLSWYDGKADERRKEREQKRDIKAKGRRYYERHRDELRAKAKAKYWADPESARENMRYYRRKRKLLDALCECEEKTGGG